MLTIPFSVVNLLIQLFDLSDEHIPLLSDFMNIHLVSALMASMSLGLTSISTLLPLSSNRDTSIAR